MGAAPEQIQESYDVGNEFYARWLDERMVYTCAAFDGDPGLSLEEAQLRKLDRLCTLAGVRPGSRVLDIGCGWGGALEHAVGVRGAREAHGLTLSPGQLAHVRTLPGVTAELADVNSWSTQQPFDALVSIGMLEHVVSPEEAARGELRTVLRRFFGHTATLARPGARFGLQTITRERMPRDPRLLRELAWATNTIFPGSLAPRLEDVVVSVAPAWELRSVETARDDYRETCTRWRARLRAAAPSLEARFGAERVAAYDRYLGTCVLAFAEGWLSLCRFSLQKTEEVPHVHA